MSYTTRFLERCTRLASALRLRPGAAEEGAAILEVAIGRDWIEHVAAADGQKFTSRFTRDEWHPIGEAYGCAGTSQIVEMLELAVYLKRLYSVPRQNEVVRQLRADYNHAFLQLAIAYRLQRTGMPLVSFEPSVAEGRHGDIEVADGDRRLLVECYCPRTLRRDRGHELERLATTLKQFMDHPIRVDVRVKRTVTAADGKRIAAKLSSLQRRIEQRLSWDDDAACIEITPIELRKISQHDQEYRMRLGGDADWCMECGSIYEDEAELLALGGDVEQRVSSLLRVWLPDSEGRFDDTTYATELSEKISRKMTQVRTAQRASRLVIAAVPGMERRDEQTHSLSLAIAQRLSQKHEDWNGVLLLSRRWLPEQRYMIFGSWIPGPASPALTADQFVSLNRLEESNDILAELGSS